MATPTPWTRLAQRLKRYEARVSQAPEDEVLRSIASLQHLVKLRSAIEDEIDGESIRTRHLGAEWAQMGYGTSKQAAQQRHQAAVKRRDARSYRALLRNRQVPLTPTSN